MFATVIHSDCPSLNAKIVFFHLVQGKINLPCKVGDFLIVLICNMFFQPHHIRSSLDDKRFIFIQINDSFRFYYCYSIHLHNLQSLTLIILSLKRNPYHPNCFTFVDASKKTGILAKCYLSAMLFFIFIRVFLHNFEKYLTINRKFIGIATATTIVSTNYPYLCQCFYKRLFHGGNR